MASGPRGAGGWSRTPRTIKVTARDTSCGVSRAQISVNGGVSYVTALEGDAQERRRQGVLPRNRPQGQPVADQVPGAGKIDTTKPKPAALGASVKRGSTATLRYRIADYSPCVVRDRREERARRDGQEPHGQGRHARSSWLTAAGFRCTLAKGTYRFYVTATDSVGYKSAKPGVGKLVVK